MLHPHLLHGLFKTLSQPVGRHPRGVRLRVLFLQALKQQVKSLYALMAGTQQERTESLHSSKAMLVIFCARVLGVCFANVSFMSGLVLRLLPGLFVGCILIMPGWEFRFWGFLCKVQRICES